MSEAGAYAATQACPTCGTRGQIREQVQLVCGACEDTIIAVPRADPTAIASEYAQRHGWYVTNGVATVPLGELGLLVGSRGAGESADLRKFAEQIDKVIAEAGIEGRFMAGTLLDVRWVPERAVRTALTYLEALPCPMRSSITDQPCVLPWGHPQDATDPPRFHKFAPPLAAAPPSSDAGSPIDVGYAALAADGTVDPKRYHLDPIYHAIVHRVYQGKPPRAAISDAGLSHPGDCPESLRPHDPGTADGCVELTKP